MPSDVVLHLLPMLIHAALLKAIENGKYGEVSCMAKLHYTGYDESGNIAGLTYH